MGTSRMSREAGDVADIGTTVPKNPLKPTWGSCTGPDRRAVGRLSARRQVYDTGAILALARKTGMEPAIPPKSNRREQRDYDKHIYQAAPHGVERLHALQALARHSNQVCQKRIVFRGCSTDSLSRTVSTYLVTTLPRIPPQDRRALLGSAPLVFGRCAAHGP